MDSHIVNHVHLLRLTGTAKERAEQHGRYIAALPKEVQKGLAFTPLSKKNQHLLHRATARIPGVGKLMGSLYEAFVLERSLRLPRSFRDRIMPFIRASKMPAKKVWLSLYQPDLLMVLAASSSPKARNRFLQGLPGCSSVRFIEDGTTYFLRNLDYPAASYWESYPAVFYHEPSEPGAIRFVSISSLGMHLSGLTGWNEKGIALSLHAHFSKQVSLRGVPIFFLGEQILERASSLDEAIEICKTFKPIGTWALNITSFKENRSVTVELMNRKIFVREPGAGPGFAHANVLQGPELKKHELHLSGAYFEDSESRKTIMEEGAQALSGRFSWPEALQWIGSHCEPHTRSQRVFGNITAGITNIQSCAFDPVEQIIYLSVRRETPVALGPYLKLPLRYQDLNSLESENLIAPSQAFSPRFLEALHLYSKAYSSYQVHSEDPKVAHALLIHASELEPQDPHLLMQRGYFELLDGQPDGAFSCFDRALREELSGHLRKVALYFRACSADLLGQREAALKDYQALLSSGPVDSRLAQKARRRLNRPFSASYCKRIEPDLQFVEPLNYP